MEEDEFTSEREKKIELRLLYRIMLMKIDEEIDANIFMDLDEGMPRLSPYVMDIVHQLGLKIDECSVSSYINDLAGFQKFISSNSSYICEILDRSFTPIFYECKLQDDYQQRTIISHTGSHLPSRYSNEDNVAGKCMQLLLRCLRQGDE